VFDEIVNSLITLYSSRGYVTNDEILDKAVAQNISVVSVERLCQLLLNRGVLIVETSSITGIPQEEQQEGRSFFGSNQDSEIEFEYDKTHTDWIVVYNKIIQIDPEMRFIINYIKHIQPPQLHEAERLLEQIKRGNKYARDRLFEMNMRPVLKIALRYAERFNLSLSDTIQDGFNGLYMAIDKFEIGKHDKFSCYAVFWILNYINRNRSINESLISLPIHMMEIEEKIYRYLKVEAPSFFKGKRLSQYEMKKMCSIIHVADTEKIELVLRVLYPTKHIEDIIFCTDDSMQEDYESSLVSNDMENIVLDRVIHEKINLLIFDYKAREKNKILSVKEQKILKFRNGYYHSKCYTLDMLGKKYGVTRERVRQIESKAIEKIKTNKIYDQLLEFHKIIER
jgi:RNA polymerase primary sigma factor